MKQLLLTCLIELAAIHSTNAQLIINGSFETPDTPTYVYIYAGQNTLAPWVVGSPYVEVGDAVGNGYITGPAFEGAQVLDLHGRLTQAFATHSRLALHSHLCLHGPPRRARCAGAGVGESSPL